MCYISDDHRYVNSYEEDYIENFIPQQPSQDYCLSNYFDQFQLWASRENTNLGVDNSKPNFKGNIQEVEKDQVLQQADDLKVEHGIFQKL